MRKLFDKEQTVQFLKSVIDTKVFSDNEIHLIVDDYFALLNNPKGVTEAIFYDFEGKWNSFAEFAEEFHSTNEDDSVDFSQEYIDGLGDFYTFCQNSKAVFRIP
jgi:protein associated with RNAse G/E